MRETTELNTAGFFPRLCAYGLDRLILAAVLLFVRLPLLFREDASRAVLFRYDLRQLVCAALSAAYFVFFTLRKGGTPGKLAMGLRVVNADGSKCGVTTILFRETVGRYLSGLLYIGYLLIPGDKEHRALHDRISDTRVVWKSREEEQTLRILTTNDAERDWYRPYRV